MAIDKSSPMEIPLFPQEDQAIDRLHRLGQRRPVRALRFVAERTVEDHFPWELYGISMGFEEIMAKSWEIWHLKVGIWMDMGI